MILESESKLQDCRIVVQFRIIITVDNFSQLIYRIFKICLK